MMLHKIFYLLRNFVSQNTVCSRQTKIGACLMLMTSMVSASAFATENIVTDSDQQLRVACQSLISDPKHDNSLPCIFYIRGFLAGARETDKVIATKLRKKYSKPTTYLERVYKYRVGKRGDRIQHMNFTHFCLPDDETEVRIIEKLSKELPTDGIQIINNRILEVLKKTCPSVSAKKK